MKHLSEGQRYEISAFIRAGLNQTEIARKLGVHKSTISRELKRNSYLGTKKYVARYANDRALSRARMKISTYRKSIPKSVYMLAMSMLVEHKYSPEQIVGYCRRKGIRMCSHESLYKWIWLDKRRGGQLYKHLRHNGRKYSRRGAVNNSRSFIIDAVDISKRPQIVDERSRFGDFEIDTIVGSSHSQHILTIVERKTGLLLMKKLSKPTSNIASDALIELLRPFAKKKLVETITSDNGRQFAHHKRISAETGGQFYFARPYHSWERGTNENTNGLVRQYIPKGSNFEKYSDEDINNIQWELNNRPRKRLGFSSPIENLRMLTGLDEKVAFDT